MRSKSKINIRNVAKLADCAPSTVSRVLSPKSDSIKISEATRARILEVCRTLDYCPSIHAMRFFSKRSRVIGILVARENMLDDEGFARALFGACEALSLAGYRALPLICNRRFEESKEYLSIFSRQEVDGLIIWGAKEKHRFLAELKGEGRPFLLLTNHVDGYPSVTANQRNAIAELVRHCQAKGARRFAAVMSRDGFSYQQRELGFLDATGDSEKKIFLVGDGVSAVDVAPELLKFSPDAVICCNDEVAVTVEEFLLAHGVKVPQDVLVTGGDNSKISSHCPVPLTTFDQRAADCAGKCVEILLRHLDEGGELLTTQLDAPIVVRQSTAR